jgi:hypothetical protein
MSFPKKLGSARALAFRDMMGRRLLQKKAIRAAYALRPTTKSQLFSGLSANLRKPAIGASASTLHTYDVLHRFNRRLAKGHSFGRRRDAKGRFA